MREPAKKAKMAKKCYFWTFGGKKMAKKSKYQKVVHKVFEGPYKDDLLKLMANFAENCGFFTKAQFFAKNAILSLKMPKISKKYSR